MVEYDFAVNFYMYSIGLTAFSFALLLIYDKIWYNILYMVYGIWYMI